MLESLIHTPSFLDLLYSEPDPVSEIEIDEPTIDWLPTDECPMCTMSDNDQALIYYARVKGYDMGFALCEQHGDRMRVIADKHEGIHTTTTSVGWRDRYLQLIRMYHPESTWQVYGDTVLFCKQFPYTHAW